MNLFVFALLAVAALKIGWGIAKLVLVIYERHRKKKFEDDFQKYIEENKLSYEQKQTQEAEIKDKRLPKRD